MTHEEISTLAIEAGLHAPYSTIERFASLVAQHERKACSHLCYELSRDPMMSSEQDAVYCAEAIRDRGMK